MVSREDFLEALPKSFQGRCQSIEVITFDQDAFRCPADEEHIQIHRGPRLSFDSIVRFWISSLSSQDWDGREAYFLSYLQSGKCRPIAEAEFNTLVKTYSGQMVQQLALPLHPPVSFVSAMQMYDDWNDVGAVAEYQDEFIAYYWDTSA